VASEGGTARLLDVMVDRNYTPMGGEGNNCALFTCQTTKDGQADNGQAIHSGLSLGDIVFARTGDSSS
jgi:hypothetical protein